MFALLKLCLAYDDASCSINDVNDAVLGACLDDVEAMQDDTFNRLCAWQCKIASKKGASLKAAPTKASPTKAEITAMKKLGMANS